MKQLLTKKLRYYIHIANDWFCLHCNSSWFHFFCLLIASANHLHCRENQTNPLDFVPYCCQHKTQRNAPFSHMQSLPKAGYWLYEHVLFYTDNGCLHFLTMRKVKKQKSKETVKNRVKHRVVCWTEHGGLALKLVQEGHNTEGYFLTKRSTNMSHNLHTLLFPFRKLAVVDNKISKKESLAT